MGVGVTPPTVIKGALGFEFNANRRTELTEGLSPTQLNIASRMQLTPEEYARHAQQAQSDMLTQAQLMSQLQGMRPGRVFPVAGTVAQVNETWEELQRLHDQRIEAKEGVVNKKEILEKNRKKSGDTDCLEVMYNKAYKKKKGGIFKWGS